MEDMSELKKQYEYIHFVEIEQKPKTKVYSCRNSDCFELGKVLFYPAFRKYSFCPEGGTVFDTKCLVDIIDFIGQLETERKNRKVSNDL